MQGLTLVFHILSALVLVGLSVWITWLTRKQRFQNLLWSELQQTHKKIYVNWPSEFLKQFAEALNFRCEVAAKGKPCPIKIKPWLEFHLQFRVLSCKLGQNDVIELIFDRPVPDEAMWRQKLRDAIPSLSDVSFVN